MDIKNFDDASSATEQLFAEEGQMSLLDDTPALDDNPTPETESEEVPEEPAVETPAETPAETPVEDTPSAQPSPADVAETAAETAANLHAELEAARARIAELEEQNAEISRKNAEATAQEALTPPTIDFEALSFADEATQRAAQEKYAAEMAEYSRKLFMQEHADDLAYAREGRMDRELSELAAALGTHEQFFGIESMLPQIKSIITQNPVLASESIPVEEKLAMAFLMAKGAGSVNNPPAAPKEPTTEEMMELYNANPDFRAMVEQQRISEIKNSQQVPPLSASSGAGNAALNIKEKPKTFEEASRRTRELFGDV